MTIPSHFQCNRYIENWNERSLTIVNDKMQPQKIKIMYSNASGEKKIDDNGGGNGISKEKRECICDSNVGSICTYHTRGKKCMRSTPVSYVVFFFCCCSFKRPHFQHSVTIFVVTFQALASFFPFIFFPLALLPRIFYDLTYSIHTFGFRSKVRNQCTPNTFCSQLFTLLKKHFTFS